MLVSLRTRRSVLLALRHFEAHTTNTMGVKEIQDLPAEAAADWPFFKVSVLKFTHKTRCSWELDGGKEYIPFIAPPAWKNQTCREGRAESWEKHLEFPCRKSVYLDFFAPGSWFKEQNKAKIRKNVSTSVILDIASLLISEITECPADHAQGKVSWFLLETIN